MTSGTTTPMVINAAVASPIHSTLDVRFGKAAWAELIRHSGPLTPDIGERADQHEAEQQYRPA